MAIRRSGHWLLRNRGVMGSSRSIIGHYPEVRLNINRAYSLTAPRRSGVPAASSAQRRGMQSEEHIASTFDWRRSKCVANLRTIARLPKNFHRMPDDNSPTDLPSGPMRTTSRPRFPHPFAFSLFPFRRDMSKMGTDGLAKRIKSIPAAVR